MSTLIAIGVVRTSFGVKGWMKISSYSGEWQHFHSLESIVLECPRKKKRNSHTVEGFKMHHNSGVLKLEDVDSPELAKTFSGFLLLVPREFAASLGEDEWYLTDMLGLQVITAQGDCVGELVSIVESSDDLLEIKRPDGSHFLAPFRKEFFEAPDMKNRTIILSASWLSDVP